MNHLTVIADTREGLPYEFENYPVNVERVKLDTGDYSIQGFEDVFAVERKSLPDLLKSISWERDRFKAEIDRGNYLAEFVVVVEAPVEEIMQGKYRSKMHPNSVFGTVNSWSRHNSVEFIFAQDRADAERITHEKLVEWYEKYQNVLV